MNGIEAKAMARMELLAAKEDVGMKIYQNSDNYKANPWERLKEQQERQRKGVNEVKELGKGEKRKGAEEERSSEKIPEKMPAIQDEYISSKKSSAKPNGLYQLARDEKGNSKILFHNWKKAEVEEDGKPQVNSDKSGNKEEKCIGSTDRVDREIEKLKQEKEQLEQQIRAASGDEESKKQLERQLSQIEQELSQKDNDSYRRQNTVFTTA